MFTTPDGILIYDSFGLREILEERGIIDDWKHQKSDIVRFIVSDPTSDIDPDVLENAEYAYMLEESEDEKAELEARIENLEEYIEKLLADRESDEKEGGE